MLLKLCITLNYILFLLQNVANYGQFLKFAAHFAASLYLIASYAWFGQQVIDEVRSSAIVLYLSVHAAWCLLSHCTSSTIWDLCFSKGSGDVTGRSLPTFRRDKIDSIFIVEEPTKESQEENMTERVSASCSFLSVVCLAYLRTPLDISSNFRSVAERLPYYRRHIP
jgi:hypothetical protein